MVRLKVTSPEAAGKQLRQMAELTAKHSQNWDNLEDIIISIIQQAYKAGRIEGTKLRHINTAPHNKYVLLAAPSGYHDTPLRVSVCKHDAEFRPLNPWIDHAGDAFTEEGGPAIYWAPLLELPSNEGIKELKP